MKDNKTIEEKIDRWTTYTDQEWDPGNSSKKSYKRFSWRVTTRVKENRKPLKKIVFVFQKEMRDIYKGNPT